MSFRRAACLVAALAAGVLLADSAAAQPSPARLRRLGLAPLPAEVPAPEENPTTPEKVALGERLFADVRLSADGRMSCATCHVLERALTDGLPRAKGRGGRELSRNTPSLLNVGLHSRLFWDGRADSLEVQALVPIQARCEMGHDIETLVVVLAADDQYVRMFRAALDGPVTADGIAKALAAYQRTLVSRESPLDRYLAGQSDALSPQAKRGLELFVGEAGCIRCHTGPLLSDGKFYRLGVGGTADKGLGGVTGRRDDLYKFRTPALRDVARTAPYMHDGSQRTLHQVVEFYFRTAGQQPLDGLPLDVEPLLGQSYTDIDAVVALLRAASGDDPPVNAAPENAALEKRAPQNDGPTSAPDAAKIE